MPDAHDEKASSPSRLRATATSLTKIAELLPLLSGDAPGVPLIDQATPLRRLNYFDGKFLRAADMAAEQQYLRQLVALSNQAGGSGVVYGLEVLQVDGDQLQINEGMAIDRDGKVVLLPRARVLSVTELIARSKKVEPKGLPPRPGAPEFADCVFDTAGDLEGGVVRDFELYEISICHAEALCGEEDVYGKLCEQACVTSTDRPLRVEGFVVRATPVSLVLPSPKTIPLTQTHLRSRAASAYYARERQRLGTLISAAALRADVWCYGAEHYGGCEIPLGLLARAGATTLFIDLWTARRERMETVPRRYWAWQMMMRPWDVFLAQILQFQCQLREVLAEPPVPSQDPCAKQGEVLGAAAKYFADIQERLRDPNLLRQLITLLPDGANRLTTLQASVSEVLKKVAHQASDRVLIDRGIIELPPAGYLPVEVGTTVSVNDQVRALLGDGVDLCFCIVHPDYVAHALEEAQHMERISLTDGLDNPAQMPEVDILVPDGAVIEEDASRRAIAYEAELAYKDEDNGPVTYDGVARHQPLPSNGRAFYLAASAADSRILLNVIEVVGKNWDQLSVHGALGAPRQPINLTRVTRAIERLRPAAVELRRRGFAVASRIDVRAQPAIDLPAVLLARRESLREVPGSAVWVDVTSSAAVTDLAPDDTATVSVRIIGAVGGASPTVATIELDGILRVRNVSPQGADGRRVEGSMLAAGLTFKRSQFGQNRDVFLARALNLSLAITEAGDEQSGSLTIEVGELDPTGAPPFTKIQHGWTAASNHSEIAVLTFDAAGAEETLARIGLSENPAVLQDGAKHALATTALDVIDAALPNDPDFEGWATKRLFAPLGEAGTELSIRAVNDWVLFHRRRTRQCEALPPRPAPDPSRSYRVYELTVPTLEEAKVWFINAQSSEADVQEEVRKQLEPPPGTPPPDLVVTFAGGSDTLSTELTSAIKADWIGFQPGTTLAYALIARGDSSNQRPLETNRLDQVIAAIPQNQTDTGQVQAKDALVSVPPGWADPGTDGAILLITVKPKPECQRVFGLSRRLWIGQQLDRLAQLDAPAIQKTLAQLVVSPGEADANLRIFDLGTATFKTADPTSDLGELSDAWKKALPNFVPTGRVMWRPSDDPDLDVHQKQSEAIAKAVVGAGDPVPEADLTNPNADPSVIHIGETCPVFTFLLGEQQFDFNVRVVVARQMEASVGGMRHVTAGPDQLFVRFESSGKAFAQGFKFDAEVASALRNVGVGPFSLVELATDDPNPPAVRNRLKIIGTELEHNGLLVREPTGAPPTVHAIKISDSDRHFLTDVDPQSREVLFLIRR